MRDNIIYVLDAAALFSSYQLLLPHDVTAVTSSSILAEVKDEDSRRSLETSLAAGKLLIIDPGEELIREAVSIADELGELSKLSKADLSLIALVIKFVREGASVTVVTDDYSVQNISKYLGVRILGIKRKGIDKVIKYLVVCPICGYVGNHIYCPRCGSKMVRKPITASP